MADYGSGYLLERARRGEQIKLRDKINALTSLEEAIGFRDAIRARGQAGSDDDLASLNTKIVEIQRAIRR